MAYIVMDTSNGNATYIAKMQSALTQLKTLYAALDDLDDIMNQMSAEQIEALFGVAGSGTALKNQVSAARTAMDSTAALVNLRTMLG